MAFREKYIEIGRVALITYGPFTNRTCVIIDVIDQNKVLVDGPSKVNHVPRHAISIKRITLTNLKVKIPHGAKLKTLMKAYEKADIANKWKNSAWGKKLLIRQKRASLSDFGRFKINIKKQEKNKIIKQALEELVQKDKDSAILQKHLPKLEKLKKTKFVPKKRLTRKGKKAQQTKNIEQAKETMDVQIDNQQK
ncbi:60S ribosomal protein L14 [Anaeramoeba ignava]|uniref:60S ribosomal protein L14 n=1 Tax=Anaeramoeba ignava TaxID=1746090 RepID=A0A9Q0R923_ANAIG|nr:60S ribosomal protein L14 [Anaeramoeba ignava]|eukprot:Anaeramoba_ignava/a611199_286.p1 GENE.a611199_286~~a611199_286.p1  ORF type:complete len:194 (-),score=62.68 a611199_286:261-842(-)